MAESPAVAPPTGWRFNHVSIRVSDLEKSLLFYEVGLGMKKLVDLSFDDLTIVLLGYPDGNGPDKVLSREGVLELVCSKHPKQYLTSPARHPDLGLAKLCFAVPDLTACMSRIKEYNISVVKKPGVTIGEELVAKALGAAFDGRICSPALRESVKAVSFVEDPDGYLLELVQY
ncbi:hypothetical protein CLAIMM_11045 [Cladophialophora immunda]|nr:hypothetical protein CLAIMM_11045 [Cladophialophora immunda]